MRVHTFRRLIFIYVLFIITFKKWYGTGSRVATCMCALIVSMIESSTPVSCEPCEMRNFPFCGRLIYLCICECGFLGEKKVVRIVDIVTKLDFHAGNRYVWELVKCYD